MLSKFIFISLLITMSSLVTSCFESRTGVLAEQIAAATEAAAGVVVVEEEEDEEASQESANEQPITQEPVTEQPINQQPEDKEPIAQQPVTEKPINQQPVTEEPVAQEPVTEEPITQQPVTEEPIAQQPVPEEPVAQEPVAEQPINQQPEVKEPIAQEPVAEQPINQEPVVESPVAENPPGVVECTGKINIDYVDGDGDGWGFQNGKSCKVPLVEKPVAEINGPEENAVAGDLLYTANFTNTKKQHTNTSRCVKQDPLNPRAINYDNLYYAGDYLINGNPWNASIVNYPYEQCMHENSNPGWSFDWGGQNDFMNSGFPWSVRSYPEIIYGVKRGDNLGSYGEYSTGRTVRETKAKTGLPVLVNKIPNIVIDLDYSATNTGDYNVSIESFFHSSCDNIATDGSASNMKYEIMLWLEKGEFNPASQDGYVGDTTIDGLPVEVWTKDPRDLHYLTFVVKKGFGPVNKRTINWSAFIDFAKQEGHQLLTTSKISNRPQQTHGGWNRRALDDNYCLANILIGTEIWNGKGEFKLNKYEIKQYKK